MSDGADPLVELDFEAEVFHWRGPAPFFFVAVPEQHAEAIRQAARSVSYGWGMVIVEASIGVTDFSTALIPKEGTYFLPLKDAVRKKAGITVGDMIAVALSVPLARR